jgi:hypothetical protein
MSDGSVLVMGGQDATGSRNDVWKSVNGGAAWTLVASTAGWTGNVTIIFPSLMFVSATLTISIYSYMITLLLMFLSSLYSLMTILLKLVILTLVWPYPTGPC